MGNKIVISIFLAFYALSAVAQNLDPTVEVSREYEGKLVEVHKPSFEMAVPDSVTRFALDFDYSVFENPYKGSYEFDPYLLSMKPSASDSGESGFYLRAGAGYQLHPTLDLVWSPGFANKGFNVDLYAKHRSFVGKYLSCLPESGSDDWSGYDLLNSAGAAFRHDWEKIALEYSAGYYGLAQQDRVWARTFNAFDASFGIHTKPQDAQSMVFDLDVDYRLGADGVGTSSLRESLGGIKVNMGPIGFRDHMVGVDAEVNIAKYTGAFDLNGGDVSLTPRYVFRKERFMADLGVRISKMLTKEKLKEQYVYPDVNLSVIIFPKSLKFYLKANGGGEFENYSSTIASNHHITHYLPQDILGYEIERIRLTVGLDGRITDKFSYNLRGGYANYASLRHYQLDMAEVPSFSMTYLSCQKWFAAVDWALDIEGFRFDGSVSYDRYWNKSDVYFGGVAGANAVLRPAQLTGKTAVQYNWKNRLVCGADCEFSDAMKGTYAIKEPSSDLVPIQEVMIRGYADVGLFAEYATARNLSLWMRVGNLLNQTIQRTPLYAEKGVFCTLGICMNL